MKETETEIDYNTLLKKNPFLKRIRKQSFSSKVLHNAWGFFLFQTKYTIIYESYEPYFCI